MAGQLYTAGYQNIVHVGRLIKLLQKMPTLYVADIRTAPYSKIPGWSKEILQKELYETFGNARYVHISELGNINYKNGGAIQLANPTIGTERIAKALRSDKSILLLCACRDYHECHRKIAAWFVKNSYPDLVPVFYELGKETFKGRERN